MSFEQFSKREIHSRINRKKSLQVLATRKLDALTLSGREMQILKKMSEQTNFRIRDYSKLGYNRPQAMQNVVSKFLKLGLLRRVEKGAREVYYSTAGDVNLVFQQI